MDRYQGPWAASRIRCAAAFVAWATTTALAAAEPEAVQVRRFDPRVGEFQPVAPEEVVPGKIYNHYSPQHGRYVWAFAEQGGRFSYALGPGSAESPRNFDLASSEEETLQVLKAAAGEDWVKAMEREGGRGKVRLGADGRWSVVKGRMIRSHFDLDSGRRYEWHGARRVAVIHSNGDQWAFVDDWYVPAIPVRWAPLHVACPCP